MQFFMNYRHQPKPNNLTQFGLIYKFTDTPGAIPQHHLFIIECDTDNTPPNAKALLWLDSPQAAVRARNLYSELLSDELKPGHQLAVSSTITKI
jgi:hypothetical protein